MKLKNRIMSWILSPGAYAVWHSMGAPEEWMWDEERKEIYHKNTGIRVDMVLWWEIPIACWIVPVLWIVPIVCWAFWPMFLDCVKPYDGAIGYIDRHLIAGRAARLRGKLRSTRSRRKEHNLAVFTKLTVNQ